MLDQHYHIQDSNEDSGIEEVEIYWNIDSKSMH